MNHNTGNQIETILLIDDDASIRITVKAILEIQGYQVIEADNGQACLDICQQQRPDLILIDAVMPEMDGFSCSIKLRQFFEYKCPPILMMTVLDDKDSIYRSFDVGITEYIVKPLDWDYLAHTIKRLLQNNQKHQELKQQFQELNSLKKSMDTQILKSLKSYHKKHSTPINRAPRRIGGYITNQVY